jgi:hypothetical protein
VRSRGGAGAMPGRAASAQPGRGGAERGGWAELRTGHAELRGTRLGPCGIELKRVRKPKGAIVSDWTEVVMVPYVPRPDPLANEHKRKLMFLREAL